MLLWTLDLEVPALDAHGAAKMLLGILTNNDPETLEREGYLNSKDEEGVECVECGASCTSEFGISDDWFAYCGDACYEAAKERNGWDDIRDNA